MGVNILSSTNTHTHNTPSVEQTNCVLHLLCKGRNLVSVVLICCPL